LKVRIYSDLHLDSYWVNGRWVEKWYPPFHKDDKQTTLILAGDLWIGVHFIFSGGSSWIEGMSRRFKQVLIVLGNHDYWPCSNGLSIKDGGRKCNELLGQMGIFNVKVLDCDTHADEEVLFVGCTLWTDMRSRDPLTMFNFSHYMGEADATIVFDDFGNGMKFSSERFVETHERHKAYIKLIAEQNRDKKIVVITHHVPLTSVGNPAFTKDLASGYYESDLSELILDNPHIKLWAYGHTHYQNDVLVGETRMINNCVGYKGQEFERQRKVKHKIIEI